LDNADAGGTVTFRPYKVPYKVLNGKIFYYSVLESSRGVL